MNGTAHSPASIARSTLPVFGIIMAAYVGAGLWSVAKHGDLLTFFSSLPIFAAAAGIVAVSVALIRADEE